MNKVFAIAASISLSAALFSGCLTTKNTEPETQVESSSVEPVQQVGELEDEVPVATQTPPYDKNPIGAPDDAQ